MEDEKQALWPRLPWHDTYCKIEGPVVADLIHSFEDRWKAYFLPDFLFDLDSSPLTLNSEQGKFFSQTFRSITDTATSSKQFQRGVHIAFLNAIRKAEKFIFMESQYFQGSSNYWSNFKNVGCLNLVPLEISKKICEKIENNEDFFVYILIPMYPGFKNKNKI